MSGDGILIPVPNFGETRDAAFRILRESGAALRQKERVYWAIAYLEPVTRAGLVRFFTQPEFMVLGKQMSASSITARVRELIDEGRVRCVGSEKDHQTGMEVELLALGRDTRGKPMRAKPEPAMGFPSMETKEEKELDWSAISMLGIIFCSISFLLGMALQYWLMTK